MRVIAWHQTLRTSVRSEKQKGEHWLKRGSFNPHRPSQDRKRRIRGGTAIGDTSEQRDNQSPQISVYNVEAKAIGKDHAQSNQKKKTTTKDKCFFHQRLSSSRQNQVNKNLIDSLEEEKSFEIQNSLEVETQNFENSKSLEATDLQNVNPLEGNKVKGNLKRHIKKWLEVGASNFIISTIKNGYKLPFINTPKPKSFQNNQSAISASDFVSSTIDDLISSGMIREVKHKPYIVSPLSVATNSVGKKRFILDLRYVNDHLHKEFVSFDDLRDFQHYVRPNGFLFKFDLRQGYYHVDIFENHQEFLGFCWSGNKEKKYYVFTVLPFGLSTAPCLFTKLLRVLVRVWHKQGIKISVFLDDGCGTAQTFEESEESSLAVKSLLVECGFIINIEKSLWSPTKVLIWLGIVIDLNKNSYHVSSKRIQSLLDQCEKILSCQYTTARSLSRLAGKVVSTKFVFSDIVRLKTRFLYKLIDSQYSWDSFLKITDHEEVVKEVIFWRDNIKRLNKKPISSERIVNSFVFSDASDHAIGSIIANNNFICHKNFSPWEQGRSSTWRELEGIRFALISFKESLKNSCIEWKTDNNAASLIVKSGSKKSELHDLAIEIYEITRFNNIDLKVQWIPRKENELADCISKVIDVDDWQLSNDFFDYLNSLWGPFSIDRFANHYNTKLERFNSKFYVPNTEAVDAFLQNWSGENNLFVPPVNDILRVLKKLEQSENIVGTLIIPHWTSKAFWAVIQKDGVFAKFISDSLFIDDSSQVLRHGMFKSALLGSKDFHVGLWALKINTCI